jgi:hypothetical protein
MSAGESPLLRTSMIEIAKSRDKMNVESGEGARGDDVDVDCTRTIKVHTLRALVK